MGWRGMAGDSVGWHGTSRPVGTAPAERRRAEPGAAGAVIAGRDTCYRAEQVLVKTQTPTQQKTPSSFTCKSIFFVSLQMFNILIKDLRFFFSFESDFGYLSLQQLLSLWPSPVIPFSTSKGWVVVQGTMVPACPQGHHWGNGLCGRTGPPCKRENTRANDWDAAPGQKPTWMAGPPPAPIAQQGDASKFNQSLAGVLSPL